jgi:thymidylate synthase (FAD)
MTSKQNVLDHGEIELVEVFGNDLTVVNAARCSYGKGKQELDERDIKLINFLASSRPTHWGPFRHVQFRFLVKVPLFIAVDWYKHVVGINYTEGATNDHAWSQFSYRFASPVSMGYWMPDQPRIQSKDNKQSSYPDLEHVIPSTDLDKFREVNELAMKTYDELIANGWAREVASTILPRSFYTKFMWTCSLQALFNFIILRDHPAAHYCIQECAKVCSDLALPHAPYSLQALLNDYKTRNP